jgi:hypothetical protein
MKEQVFSQIIGDIDVALFIASLFWAIVGAILSLFLDGMQRNPTAPASPVHFKWKFFIQDNWKRALTSLLLILAVLRFYKEITGTDLSTFFAFVVGLGLDRFAMQLKRLKRGKNDQPNSQ